MESLVTVTLAVAWTAIVGMLVWGLVRSWRTVWQDDGSLPMFAMLARRGLAPERLERLPEPFYAALRRCALCSERRRCRDWLARRIGDPAPACPNQTYFEDAARA